MVSDTGQAKILDFGLAKLLQDEPAENTKGTNRADITELGIPYGTATYAAPEQAKGEKTDHRADIFSTGVLLYEMLTGIWAFQGKTVHRRAPSGFIRNTETTRRNANRTVSAASSGNYQQGSRQSSD